MSPNIETSNKSLSFSVVINRLRDDIEVAQRIIQKTPELEAIRPNFDAFEKHLSQINPKKIESEILGGAEIEMAEDHVKAMNISAHTDWNNLPPLSSLT